MFNQFRPYIARALNYRLVRQYVGIDHEVDPEAVIVDVTPNGYSYLTGRKINGRVELVYKGRSYPLIAQKFEMALKLAGAIGAGFTFPHGIPAIALTVGTQYSGSGDAVMVYQAAVGNSDSNWNAMHDATSVSFYLSSTDTTFGAGCDWTDRWYMRRSACPFDLSSLPSSAIVSAVTVQLYGQAKSNGDNDGDDWINFVGPTTTASDTSITNNDWNDIGAVNNPQELATRIDFGSLSASAYNMFTFNATGIGVIQDAMGVGYAKLGFREGHDALDHKQATSSNTMFFYTSNQTGTANDPLMSITYTLPAGVSGGHFAFM